MAWSSGLHSLSSHAATVASHHQAVPAHAQLDGLMLFGLMSTTFTLCCYVNRNNGKITWIVFSASLIVSAIYGFLEGVWPLAALDIVWAIEAARRGFQNNGRTKQPRPRRAAFVPNLESRQSRYGERYGEIYGLN